MKNKFLFLIFFVVTLFAFSSVSFATSISDIVVSDGQHSLPSVPKDRKKDYPYYIVVYNKNLKTYTMHLFKNVPVIDYKYPDDSYLLIQYPKNNLASASITSDDLSSWVGFGGHTLAITIRSSDTELLYNNFELKDTSGKVYYQTQKLNSKIFGVMVFEHIKVILPILLITIIGFIAFRKGFSYLKQSLQSA